MTWEKVPLPQLVFAPRHYECLRTRLAPDLDGRLDKPFWAHAPWTEDFVDIEGDVRPVPAKRTRAKLLWDDDCLYIGAELEEDAIWATQTERDCVIFQDNDFEVFIDPDGDSHAYYEFEMNALNTVWDLLLTKPYRDGGRAVNGWDIHGLRTAVHIGGTLNEPGPQNRFWSLEIAMPWEALRECAPGGRAPVPGDCWRINFSRVEWRTEVVDGQYRKVICPDTGKPYPEDNWIWSAQGIVNMHYPEFWGFLAFRGDRMEGFRPHPDEARKWLLRQVYYAERAVFAETGCFSESLDRLAAVCPGLGASGSDRGLPMPVVETTRGSFLATIPSADGRHHLTINEEGRTARLEA